MLIPDNEIKCALRYPFDSSYVFTLRGINGLTRKQLIDEIRAGTKRMYAEPAEGATVCHVIDELAFEFANYDAEDRLLYPAIES